MRIDPDKDLLSGDFATLVGGDFVSSLPPVGQLQAAWADARAAYFSSGEELGKAFVENAVRAFRFVSARAGVEIGIPADVLGSFANAISLGNSDQAASAWADFAVGIAEAAIDAAVQAMGAIPFVGWVAKVVFAILELIRGAIEHHQPKPAPISYDNENDEAQARRFLEAARSLDWTFLFLPASSPETWGDWEAHETSDGGYLFRPKASVSRVGHAGGVPGGPLGSVGVQVRHCLATPTLQKTGFTDTRLEQIKKFYNDHYRDAQACVVDAYETTPSVARVVLAAWQNMTQKRTATLFQVDTRPIDDAWKAYCSTAVAASRANTTNVNAGALDWVLWRSLETAMYVHGWKLRGDDPDSDRVERTARLDEVAARYALDLRKRQRAAMDTMLVAFAREGQACFKDPAMRALLVKRRGQLLRSDSVWLIDPGDVLDDDFRAAVIDATRNPGDRPLAGTPDQGPHRMPIPDADPMPLPDGTSADDDDGGGAAVVVIGGLAMLGLAGWGLARYMSSPIAIVERVYRCLSVNCRARWTPEAARLCEQPPHGGGGRSVRPWGSDGSSRAASARLDPRSVGAAAPERDTQEISATLSDSPRLVLPNPERTRQT